MVEIRKRIVITLCGLLIALCASAQTNSGFAERQLKQLGLRSERVAAQLEQTRNLYATNANDSLALVLHELERQSQTINAAIERIKASLATPEPQPIEASEPQIDTIAQQLGPVFTTALRRYAIIEKEIDEAFEQYTIEYKNAEEFTHKFDDATNLADALSAGKGYDEAMAQMEKLATIIADNSDHLFTSKTNAMMWFADSLAMNEAKSYYWDQNQQIESTFTEELRGQCTDLDMAMYPYRKAALMNLEVKLARRMCGDKQADSLLNLMAQINTDEALFAPFNGPKRSDAKFGEVAIHSQHKYSGVGAIPAIEIPNTGELYSILLGNYASLPSIKSFRKAAPLYTERREDGRTYIYAGLYPTAKSAQHGMEVLRKAGFKQPTLVMWHNGLRRDDYVDRTTTPTTTTAMYKIEIRGADYGLSEAISNVIKEKAPRKEISKFTTDAGAIVYTLGIFTKESEADDIAKAIRTSDESLIVKVSKVGK